MSFANLSVVDASIHCPFLRFQPADVTVTVEPVFLECCKPEPEVKIGLNVRVGLTCEAPWVVAPAHLVIMNVARV